MTFEDGLFKQDAKAACNSLLSLSNSSSCDLKLKLGYLSTMTKLSLYLLSKSQEQGFILHPFQVQVGVRVQHLQALEQLIIQSLNKADQVAPYLQAIIQATSATIQDKIGTCV